MTMFSIIDSIFIQQQSYSVTVPLFSDQSWYDMWLTQLSTIFLLYIGGGNHSFEENYLLKGTDLIIQSCIEYKQEFNKYVILVLISWLEHFEWFTQSMMIDHIIYFWSLTKTINFFRFLLVIDIKSVRSISYAIFVLGGMILKQQILHA